MASESQVIINFGGDEISILSLENSIYKHATEKGKPVPEIYSFNCQGIDLANPNTWPKDLQPSIEKLNKISKVYVIDHGLPNSNRIENAHYQELGDFLAPILQGRSDEKTAVSLVSCFAASGPKGEHSSFAGKLHRYLGQARQIPCTVLARKDLLHLSAVEKKTSSVRQLIVFRVVEKLCSCCSGLMAVQDLLRHQSPGSKIAFSWGSQGSQLISDAYVSKQINGAQNLKNDILLNWDSIPFHENQAEQIENLLHQIPEGDAEGWKKEDVKNCYKCLSDIQGILAPNSDPLSLRINFEIKNWIGKTETTTGNDSLDTKIMDDNLHDAPSPREMPIGQTMQLLLNETLIASKKLVGDDTKPYKDSAQRLLTTVMKSVHAKLEKEQDLGVESFIIHAVKKTTDLIASEGKTTSQKESELKNISKDVTAYFEKNTAILGSPYLKGLMEGFGSAKATGGFMGLKIGSSLMKQDAYWNTEKHKLIVEQIDSFFIEAYKIASKKDV